MASIDIERRHTLGLAQARAAVEDVARRIAERFGIDYAWRGDALGFSRPGVDGAITVSEDRVHVGAKLGMMMGMLKTPIEQEIRRVLDERFGPAP